MSAGSNEAIIRRFFETVWNQGEVERTADFLSPEFVSHNGLQLELLGPDGYARGVSMMRGAVPDLHTTLEIVVADETHVCVRGRDSGTHLGELFGRPPSGRPLTLTWIEIFAMRNGKATEGWLEFDTAGFLAQLQPEAPAGQHT